MIPDFLIREIQRRLAGDKPSERRIAQQLGVARGTVRAVARGRLTPRVGVLPPDDDHDDLEVDVELRLYDEEPLEPPQRCPICGGMVFMPCQLCRLRKLKRPLRPLPPTCMPRPNCRQGNPLGAK